MLNFCIVHGCYNKPKTRNMCSKHYMRWFRNGSPLVVKQYHDGRGSLKTNNKSEFNSWIAMRARCLSASHKQFKDYGGRGIKICSRWSGRNGFKHFLEDMGKRPDKYTLDRIDVNGDYCPENCRWASRKEQTANRRPLL